MNIETTRCQCDECGGIKPNSIILTTSDGYCRIQLCNLCARRALFLLTSELEEESK